MPDPFLASARYIINDYLAELRAAVDGLPDEAVNWKPASDDTNSIAVLTIHNLNSTRSWISIAVGAPLPDRDCDLEFDARAENAAELLLLIDDIGSQILTLLDGAGDIDWAENRRTHLRPDPELPNYVPAAYGILHAVEHFSQHVGHVTLTRQIWDAR
ncbi:MAG: DinB family protein [Dehalococcoidia bacterium]